MLSLKKIQRTGSPVEPLFGVGLSIAVGLVYAGVVLTFQPFGLDQFLLPKALVLLIGIPLVLGFLIGVEGMGFRRSGDALLVGLVATFLIWSVVAPAWHAANPKLHGADAFEALAFGVLFFGARRVTLCGPKAVSILLCFMALPVLVVAPLAVAQGLGVDPLRIFLDLNSTRPGRWQVLTTLGNPTWTAELIVLTVPFAFAAFSSRIGRWRLWCAGAFLVWAVAVTGSRGALVGLLVVAVVSRQCGLIPGVDRGRRTGRISRVVGTLLVVALIVGFVGMDRLGDLKPVTGRLGMWVAGAHLVGERPVAGWGLGNTNLVLPVGLERVAAGVSSRHQEWLPTKVVDRLDHDLLQVAVERGLPAAILIIFVVVRALSQAVRRLRRRQAETDGVIVAFLAAYIPLSLISAPFHTPATASLFWIAVGLAAGLNSNGHEEPENEPFPSRIWPVIGAAVATLLAGVVVAPVMKVNALAGAGHRHLMDDRFEVASDILRPVVFGEPWLVGASIDRARALIETGGEAEALVILEDAEFWASSEWIWATRARALDRLGLENEARRVLEAGFGVLPRSPVLVDAWTEVFPDESRENFRHH